ncbi:MAG: undecaprenyl-diphosphate phosphatase [Oscillospiraceae bacterium]|jgi:undecaprenyl-diphosphatase|nr:undecaprenyl-diphosphate phosphatase [Oscillospiraceae bacterium]
MPILLAILLGIVQGVAEFLPISSSGHLAILERVFGLTADGSHLLFDVLLHVGTLVAICLSYKKELGSMIHETVEFIARRDEPDATHTRLRPPVRMVLLIAVATIPLFIAVPFSGKIELLFAKTGFVGVALLVTGVLVYVVDSLLEQQGTKKEKTLTLKDAFVIGLAQAAALLPGVSRSGATIAVGAARGAEREFAVKFSLLMSIPAVIGSTLLTLVKAIKDGIVWGNVPAYLLGALFAAVVGFFMIQVLRRVLQKGKFRRFAYYCWGVGVLAIVLSIAL